MPDPRKSLADVVNSTAPGQMPQPTDVSLSVSGNTPSVRTPTDSDVNQTFEPPTYVSALRHAEGIEPADPELSPLTLGQALHYQPEAGPLVSLLTAVSDTAKDVPRWWWDKYREHKLGTLLNTGMTLLALYSAGRALGAIADTASALKGLPEGLPRGEVVKAMLKGKGMEGTETPGTSFAGTMRAMGEVPRRVEAAAEHVARTAPRGTGAATVDVENALPPPKLAESEAANDELLKHFANRGEDWAIEALKKSPEERHALLRGHRAGEVAEGAEGWGYRLGDLLKMFGLE